MTGGGGNNPQRDNLDRALDDAWHAFRAISLAQKEDPSLGDNPYWLMLRGDAFEAFNTLFARHRDAC